jgi:hypothetical protein
MSRGPQVPDMEYQEQDRLEHGPGGPIFSPLKRLHFVSSSIHHLRLGPASEMVLAPQSNESRYHGMCHSDPQKTFEYVHLIPLFLTGAWILCLST